MSETSKPSAIRRLQALAAAARRAQEGSKDAEEARNRAIADAETDGWSIGDIAKACELSKNHIHRICVEQAEARQQHEAD